MGESLTLRAGNASNEIAHIICMDYLCAYFMEAKLNAKIKRRSINLTISEDIIADAKALELNASQAAEAGLAEAIRKAKEKKWLEENRAAIEAHNERVEKHGTMLPAPGWARK
ncbi:MAG: type II toxin-antitoxin system CcdA family antitoxin [Pseudomonadota bacterium]